MARLILLAALLIGAVVAASRPQPPASAATAQPAPAREVAQSAAPVAYRPGEPMLVPGPAAELRRSADGHFYADTLVNGHPVAMLVDTGASTVALTVADAQRLGIAVDPTAFQVVGTGVSGPARGTVTTLDDVALGAVRAGPVRAVVIEGLDRSLLGQSFLSRLQQVQIDGDRMTLR
jgi:aspartyl protease family protein